MPINVSSSIKNNFSFNGKTYSSLDEMEPEVRKYFEDKDKSGLPDYFEEKLRQVKSPFAKKLLGGLFRLESPKDDSNKSLAVNPEKIPINSAKSMHSSRNTPTTTKTAETNWLMPLICIIIILLVLLLYYATV